jgi:plastocyanin
MSEKKSRKGEPGTVTIVLPQSLTIKTRYLWATLAIIMTLMVLSPVAAYYFPPASGAGPVVVPSTGGGGGTTAQVNCQNPCRVVIKNSVFGTGQPVIVSKGTQVIWVNSDDTTHTSTSDSGIWDTGILPVGASAAPVTFSTDGVFPYFCNVHPMTGVVEVVG